MMLPRKRRFLPGEVVVHYPYAAIGEVVRHDDTTLAVKWDGDDEFIYNYAPDGVGIQPWPDLTPETP